MMERFDQANIEHLIVNTVTVLCKNRISFTSELRIQGTVGITVDSSRVILVQLNHCFEYGAEDNDRNASESDAADGVHAKNYSVAGVKRPRMTSVIHCTRRPSGYGRGRGHVPIEPVRRVRHANAVIGAKVSAQRVRQQLAFPSPNKVALTKSSGVLQHTPMQHVSPPLSTSPQFHARHVAANIVSTNEVPQQLHTKLEVEEGGRSSFEMIHQPMSSDIINIESDDETESAAKVNPGASTLRQNSVSVKSEGQSQDALQMIVDRAVMAARANNPGMTESSSSPNAVIATAAQRSTPSLCVHVDSMSMQCGDRNLVEADIKPTAESTNVALQQWTPSKRLIMSPAKTLMSTPTSVKTEVGARSPVFSCSKPIRPSSVSKIHSSPGIVSPVATTPKGASARSAASWTSVTETTFICTTAGCAKRFTTKRALVRHQKDKHGLVTRQMLSSGGQTESDSDTPSGIL